MFRYFITFLLTLAVSSLSCLAETQSSAFSIGAILPLSGPLASVGEAVKNSMLIAQEKYDRDKRVSFHFEDDSYLPKNTVSAYRKLTSSSDLQGLFVFGSPSSLSVAPMAEKARLPMISIAMTSSLTDGKEYIVRYNVTAQSVDKEVRREVKKRNYSTVALVTTENDATLDIRSRFLKDPPTKVVFDETFVPEERDFRATAAKILELAPSAVYILLMPPASANFAKQIRSLGYNGELFGTPPLGTREELEASQGALLGAWYVSGDDRAAKDFYDDYHRRHGVYPITEAAYGHDIAKLLIEVVGETLGALSNRSIVDRIAPNLVHPAATSARAEWDDGPEDVIQDLPLLGGDVLKHRVSVRLVARFAEPHLDVRLGRGGEPARIDRLLNRGTSLVIRQRC